MRKHHGAWIIEVILPTTYYILPSVHSLHIHNIFTFHSTFDCLFNVNVHFKNKWRLCPVFELSVMFWGMSSRLSATPPIVEVRQRQRRITLSYTATATCRQYFVSQLCCIAKVLYRVVCLVDLKLISRAMYVGPQLSKTDQSCNVRWSSTQQN